MTEKKNRIRIKFDDGEIKTIRPVKANLRVLKKEFRQYTGVNCDLITVSYDDQLIKALLKWLDKHGLYHPEARNLIVTVEGLIASEERIGREGFIAFAEEDHECLLVITPANDREYVWRISKMINDRIRGKRINFDKRIVVVTFLDDEIKEENITDLRQQLGIAIDTEKYELAAKLRDKISSMDNKKLPKKNKFQ